MYFSTSYFDQPGRVGLGNERGVGLERESYLARAMHGTSDDLYFFSESTNTQWCIEGIMYNIIDRPEYTLLLASISAIVCFVTIFISCW